MNAVGGVGKVLLSVDSQAWVDMLRAPFMQTSVGVDLMQLVHDLPNQCVSTFKLSCT